MFWNINVCYKYAYLFNFLNFNFRIPVKKVGGYFQSLQRILHVLKSSNHTCSNIWNLQLMIRGEPIMEQLWYIYLWFIFREINWILFKIIVVCTIFNFTKKLSKNEILVLIWLINFFTNYRYVFTIWEKLSNMVAERMFHQLKKLLPSVLVEIQKGKFIDYQEVNLMIIYQFYL